MATVKKKKKAAPRKRKPAPPPPRRKKSAQGKANKYVKMAADQYALELGKLGTKLILAKTKTEKNKIRKKVRLVQANIRKLRS